MIDNIKEIIKGRISINNSDLEKLVFKYNLNDDDLDELAKYMSLENIDIVNDEFKEDKDYVEELDKSSCDIQKSYYKTILSYPLLNHDELIHLLKKYNENDDKEALNKIVLSNLRLVYKVSKMYHCTSMSFDDFFQEGVIGLYNGIKKYDYTKGYKLSTFVLWDIKASINRSIVNKGRTVRLPVSIAGKVNTIRNTKQMLEDKYKKEITPNEIASYLNCSLDYVTNLMDVSNPVLSLNSPTGNTDEGMKNELSYKVPIKENMVSEFEDNELNDFFLNDVFEILTEKCPKEYTKEQLYNIYNFFTLYYNKKSNYLDSIRKSKITALYSYDFFNKIIKNCSLKEISYIESSIINNSYNFKAIKYNYPEEYEKMNKNFEEIENSFAFNMSTIYNDKELNNLFIKAGLDEEDSMLKFERKYYPIFISIREYEVICYRYGIDGRDVRTLSKIKDKYGITRERVRQIENLAIKTLKKSFNTSKVNKKYSGSDFLPKM